MKRAILCLTALLALNLRAENPLREIEWDKYKLEEPNLPGQVVEHATPSGQAALLVESNENIPLTIQVAIIENPGISNRKFALRGSVRYENVRGDAYLEIWTHIGQDKFFSRTLAETGAMKKISGTSDWREFILPFDNTGAAGDPSKLDFNVVLPGSGKIWIGPVKLVQGEPALPQSGAWWDERSAGWIGGISGSLIGLLFAIFAWLTWRGKAQKFVQAFCILMISIGISALTLGIIALLKSQPYAVYYILLLLGGMTLFYGIGMLIYARRRKAEDEYRRMLAADAV
jgi:hypothetical protein